MRKLNKQDRYNMQWLDGLFKMIKPGGCWVCPCSGSIYQIFNDQKIIILIEGKEDDKTNQKTKEYAEMLGYICKSEIRKPERQD